MASLHILCMQWYVNLDRVFMLHDYLPLYMEIAELCYGHTRVSELEWANPLNHHSMKFVGLPQLVRWERS